MVSDGPGGPIIVFKMSAAYIMIIVTINIILGTTDYDDSPAEILSLTLDEKIRLFQDIPSLNGLAVVEVERDGNCALHAILDQLLHTGSDQSSNALTISTLRTGAVNVLRECPIYADANKLETRLYKDWNTYLRKQSLDGEWLDELMLRAISDFTGKEIAIHHENNHITYIKPSVTVTSSEGEAEYSGPVLKIGQIGEQHYVSLRKSAGVISSDHPQSCISEVPIVVDILVASEEQHSNIPNTASVTTTFSISLPRSSVATTTFTSMPRSSVTTTSQPFNPESCDSELDFDSPASKKVKKVCEMYNMLPI